MQEENYLDQLFEAARSEAPKLSYEQAAQRFELASAPSGLELFREWIQQHFFIKTLLMFSIGSTLIVSLWLFLNPVQQEKIVLATMPVQVLEEEQDTSILEVPKDLVAPVQILKPMYALPILPVWQPEEMPYYEAPLSDTFQEKQDYTLTTLPEPNLPEALQSEKSPPKIEVKETVKSLVLEKDATEEEVSNFIKGLMEYVFFRDLDLKPTSRKMPIEKLILRLGNKASMDWEMKLRGFDKLELKLTLDENQKLETLSFRIDDKGEFSSPARFKGSKNSRIRIAHTHDEN